MFLCIELSTLLNVDSYHIRGYVEKHLVPQQGLLLTLDGEVISGECRDRLIHEVKEWVGHAGKLTVAEIAQRYKYII